MNQSPFVIKKADRETAEHPLVKLTLWPENRYTSQSISILWRKEAHLWMSPKLYSTSLVSRSANPHWRNTAPSTFTNPWPRYQGWWQFCHGSSRINGSKSSPWPVILFHLENQPCISKTGWKRQRVFPLAPCLLNESASSSSPSMLMSAWRFIGNGGLTAPNKSISRLISHRFLRIPVWLKT